MILRVSTNISIKLSYQQVKIKISLYCALKGQLISKGLVGILNSPKKWTKKFDLQYYDTSGRLVFIRFLEELKTPKSPLKLTDLYPRFQINSTPKPCPFGLRKWLDFVVVIFSKKAEEIEVVVWLCY